MRLERLEVVEFRNHDGAAVEFPAGVSVLVGPNGAGKTNLLEAIGYLATLGSHRVGQDAALIRAGAASAVIRAAVQRAGRRLLVDVELRPGSGVRGRVNGAPVPRARDLLGVVRATVFAPEDLGLVRGDPEERRRFLDTLATQRLPRYHGSRQDYDRVLRQRNTLLRSAGGRLPTSAWPGGTTWSRSPTSPRSPGPSGSTPTRPSWPRRCASGWSPTGLARSSGASPCPAPTGTTWRSACATCPPAPMRPTARHGRWPSPCVWGRTGSWPRRARSRCC